MTKQQGKSVDSTSERLKSFVTRIENLEEAKREIAEDIKDVYAEAKGTGFDAPTIREIVKLRRMSSEQRQEREALLDLYKGAMGMLDGTPLGRYAVERLNKPEVLPETESDEALESLPKEQPAVPTEEEARVQGKAAALSGHAISTNPFGAGDRNRAAWDEGWCSAAGSDGMDVPDAWRRKPKPSKGDE